MAIKYEKIVGEDLNLGHGAVQVTNPQGGTLAGEKIGVHTILPGWFNVKDFGARGDGATDDTAAIQGALDQAGTTGIVLFPPATYIHAGLVVPAGRHSRIRAHGATIVFSAGSGIAVDVRGTLADRSGLTVWGGEWAGQDAATGFKFAFCTLGRPGLLMSDVYVRNFSDGIHVTDTHSGRFVQVSSLWNARYGVYLDGESSYEMGAVNNAFWKLHAERNLTGVRCEGSAGGNQFYRPELSANSSREMELLGTVGRNPGTTLLVGPRFERGGAGYEADAALVIDTTQSRPRGIQLIAPVISGAYPIGIDVVSAIDVRIFSPNIPAATVSVRATTGAGGGSRDVHIVYPQSNMAPVEFLASPTTHRIIGRPGGSTGIAIANFALSAGWGNTAAVSAVLGRDDACSFRVTSAGTGQGVNPTITVTFHTSWGTGAAPFFIVARRAGNQMDVPNSWVVTDTTLTITFAGTPVAGEIYEFQFLSSA